MTLHKELLERYFEACTYCSLDEIAAFFCTEAAIYDNNREPARGAQATGTFYVEVRERWQGASWSVDTLIEGEGCAASEWTMPARDNGEIQLARGSEHYEFSGGLIPQIRQY